MRPQRNQLIFNRFQFLSVHFYTDLPGTLQSAPRWKPPAERGEQRGVSFGVEEARPEGPRTIDLAAGHLHPDGLGRMHREIRSRGLAFKTFAAAVGDPQPVIARLRAADAEMNLGRTRGRRAAPAVTGSRARSRSRRDR